MTEPTFTQQDIEILNEETLYSGFFTLKRIQFRHKLFAGGMSGTVTRELLVKGAASAVIAYDPMRDEVILVEQVRIGAYNPKLTSSPWLLELIAGMVEEGETPEGVALRESEEEAGVQVENLQHALSVWDSPGGVLERIHVFAGKVDCSQAQGLQTFKNGMGELKNGKNVIYLSFLIKNPFKNMIYITNFNFEG